MSQSLSREERALLLELARHTILHALQGIHQDPMDLKDFTPQLQAPGATFVTLHTRSGALRGCIGSLQARNPLIEDVRNNALAAAFEDPRFPAVTESELPGINIEISVLSSPQPLAYEDAEDLLHKLRPHIDGVVLESGWHRATFLPQVWEQLPLPVEFLSNLCYKAGIPGDAWRYAGVKISTYQVEEFTEPV